MTRIFISFCLILCSLFSLAQKEKSLPNHVEACISLGDNYHIKQTEVSLADWFAFLLEDGLVNGKNQMLVNLPDSLKIPENYRFLVDIFLRNFDLSKSKTYLSQKAKEKTFSANLYSLRLPLSKDERKDIKKIRRLLDMPVTGVSFDQVQNYIGWCEARQNKISIDRGEYDFVYAYSLPEIAAYDSIFKQCIPGGTDPEFRAKEVAADSVNSPGCPLFNFLGSSSCQGKQNRGELFGSESGPVPVYSFHPSETGIYNIYGNASEMTAEKGVSYGGSCYDYAKKILNSPQSAYSGPEKGLGFRYMVRILPAEK